MLLGLVALACCTVAGLVLQRPWNTSSLRQRGRALPRMDLVWLSATGQLQGANLQGVNLAGADLREMNLSGADLRGANLAGADLREADLQRANMAGANLTESKLGGARYDGATEWPGGVDPGGEGARKKETARPWWRFW